MLNTRPKRLRTLLILIATLGLLPITLLGTWGIKNVVNQQGQQLEASMLRLSRALASAVDAELDATISTVRILSYDKTLVYGDLHAFYGVSLEAIRSRPDWASINLADGKANLLFKTSLPYGSSDARITEPNSLTHVLSIREPIVGSIAKGQFGRAAFPVRVPVIDGGSTTYVLTAAVKPDRILQILKRQEVPNSWVISIQDASNLRVARSKDHEQTVAKGISPSLTELMQKGRFEGAGISRTLDGDKVMTAYTRTPRHGWTVVVGVPVNLFQQIVIQPLALYAAGFFLSLFICIGLAYGISWRISGAIAGLRDQAIHLLQGQPIQIQPTPIQEINEMGLALKAASIERVLAEEERERLLASLNTALAQAEKASHAKDNFLAVLGHELRNPLAPMVTVLDLMDARRETANGREREIMRRQVEHMKRLVDDLLDISRITQGKLQVRKAPICLTSVVQQAVEAVDSGAGNHEHMVNIVVKDDMWVMGDEARLIQVVTNLLNNALHFDQQGKVSILLEREGEDARLSVSDEGAGMTADTVAQIFQPFYQAPQPLARPSGGLGLGLAIVERIVALHDGQVAVASEGLGKGSTFTVRLPAISPPVVEQATTLPEAGTVPCKILVVDDNKDAAHTLAQVLEMHGHETQVAYDGGTGLIVGKEFLPDVAILDIGLPEMDGYALAKALRSHSPNWNGKLVALSGYGQVSDKARATEAGFATHFTKPIDLGELLRYLGQAKDT